MISYELAKELKGAGFHQDREEQQTLIWPTDKMGTFPDCAYNPTLSELIAKCPRQHEKGNATGNFDLYARDADWIAGYEEIDEGYVLFAVGATPEEAVARLWLALPKS